MTDLKKALLSEIRASPDDLVSRLVYADWLEENGDPLADLIRVQCELAELPADSPEISALAQRERDLLAEYHEQWVQPLKDRFGAIGVVMKGGFVESLRITADTFLENAEEIVEMLPALCSLTLGRPRNRIQELAETPALQHVPGLDLRGAGIGDEGLVTLLKSPHLGRLLRLNLSGNKLSADGAGKIASSELTSLRSLDLSRNSVGDEGIRQLGESPALHQLRELDARHCEMTLNGFAVLCSTTGIPRLEHLNLAQNNLAGSLPGSADHSRSFQTLRLWDASISDESIRVLGAAASGASVTLLDVSDNSLGSAALAHCLEQERFPLLRGLIAMRNVFGVSETQQMFYEFPELVPLADKPLDYLNLSRNQLSDDSFRQLARSGCLRQATTLRFNETGIDIPGLRSILGSAENLTSLSVCISGDHLRSSRRRPRLGRLLRELAAWPGMSKLRSLEVGDSVLSDVKGFGQLLNSPHRDGSFRIVSKFDYHGDREKISGKIEKRFGPEANIIHWA